MWARSDEEKKSIITLREVGRDVPTFGQAARYALRQDPDVIHVGEMRDLETISLCLVLAESGHAVFTTIHTGSAQETVDRLIEVFPQDQRASIRRQLADTLGGIVCQALLPRTEGRGRVPACEILIATPEMRDLIRQGSTEITAAVAQGQEQGMQTMAQAIEQLQHEGVISKETAEETLAAHLGRG